MCNYFYKYYRLLFTTPSNSFDIYRKKKQQRRPQFFFNRNLLQAQKKYPNRFLVTGIFPIVDQAVGEKLLVNWKEK